MTQIPQVIHASFIETITNFLLLGVLVGVVIPASFYFMGRIEENEKLLLERRFTDRMKRLNKILNRLGVEDVEREE